MSRIETGTVLDAILARTVADLEVRQRTVAMERLEHEARAREPTLSLRQALAGPGLSIVAEIKRASPSRGRFATVVDAGEVARDYIAGGAAAISVLTDQPFFQGSLRDLEAAADVAHGAGAGVPLLRKDFVIDAYQIVEARAHGADAVLLIVSALPDALLADLLQTARRWGMDALVEVHDEGELARALAVGATVIGINNRDLKTFAVDLAVTERLAPLTPADTVTVAESGIFGSADAERMTRAGVDAVLVGESLIMAGDRVAAVRALRTWTA